MNIRRIIISMLAVSAAGIFWNLTAGAADDLRRTPVVRAVESVKQAVVSVSTREQTPDRSNPFSSMQRDPFFDRFFDNFFDNGFRRRESVQTHLGSGVIIDARGYVLTNWHVIEKASAIMITTSEDKEYKALLVGADRKSDLAVLKIQSSESFSAVPRGDSDDMLIGETVIAIGNPFGLSHTVTTGVVSALHRSIRANEQVYEDFIQTDASINPGNSGGPLLNINGQLVGINTAIYGEAQGIGFAIPINTAHRIVGDLLRYGEVRPPWVGIMVGELTHAAAAKAGYTGAYGSVVTGIEPGSPAAQNGLEAGDIIIAIGDQKVKSPTVYKRLLSLYTADATLKVELCRQGSVRTVMMKAAEIPLRYVESIIAENLGFETLDNSADVARRYGLASAEGIVIARLTQSGQARQRGLKPGDIIVQIQGRDIKNVQDFKHQVRQNIYMDSIVLLVQRGYYGYYVTFDL